MEAKRMERHGLTKPDRTAGQGFIRSADGSSGMRRAGKTDEAGKAGEAGLPEGAGASNITT
jgi:hypothetical protein